MLTTEQPSAYRHLEKMSVKEIITYINDEDKTVATAVEKALPQIEKLIIAIADKILAGGRLFYIGAGTSGRLGILDASECPPTFGVSYELVQGLIAGGFNAIIRAAEFAEDDDEQGWIDIQQKNISYTDFVIGIAASGTTPYVIGALQHCKENNIDTGCITCNADTPLAAAADYPVEVITGAEFVTGSTRMKAGTAQKMVLNMISTAVMIQMGRVEDNSMVNMQLSNEKLIDRGVKMLMQQANLTNYKKAKEILLQKGSVKKAVESIQKT
ncbi:MAG: N-acetylmuramic acid 6-phosphate etherase [Parafilimonas sp.]